MTVSEILSAHMGGEVGKFCILFFPFERALDLAKKNVKTEREKTILQLQPCRTNDSKTA